jgi:NADH-ubiquinone oxidoreductase chain 6
MLSRFLYSISSHPVILTVIILAQTILICLIIWVKLKISWFSYILFLIFLGGLIVLFIYITRLASNELINTKIDFNFVVITVILIFTTFFIFLKINPQLINSIFETQWKTFSFIYSVNIFFIVVVTIIYLLLTLLIVVKLSNKYDAPIKNLIHQ